MTKIPQLYEKWNEFIEDAQDDPKIEERLRLLESQMADVNGDIKNMDEEVNFLLDEQVLQDERLVDLEGENEG